MNSNFTLAQLKRDLKKGDILTLIDAELTFRGEKNWLIGIPREITIKQSNAIALKTPDKEKDGEFANSWFNFPTARELHYFELDGKRYFDIYESDSNDNLKLILKYKIN